MTDEICAIRSPAPAASARNLPTYARSVAVVLALGSLAPAVRAGAQATVDLGSQVSGGGAARVGCASPQARSALSNASPTLTDGAPNAVAETRRKPGTNTLEVRVNPKALDPNNPLSKGLVPQIPHEASHVDIQQRMIEAAPNAAAFDAAQKAIYAIDELTAEAEGFFAEFAGRQSEPDIVRVSIVSNVLVNGRLTRQQVEQAFKDAGFAPPPFSEENGKLIIGDLPSDFTIDKLRQARRRAAEKALGRSLTGAENNCKDSEIKKAAEDARRQGDASEPSDDFLAYIGPDPFDLFGDVPICFGPCEDIPRGTVIIEDLPDGTYPDDGTYQPDPGGDYPGGDYPGGGYSSDPGGGYSSDPGGGYSSDPGGGYSSDPGGGYSGGGFSSSF